jgi:hypothetical protein
MIVFMLATGIGTTWQSLCGMMMPCGSAVHLHGSGVPVVHVGFRHVHRRDRKFVETRSWAGTRRQRYAWSEHADEVKQRHKTPHPHAYRSRQPQVHVRVRLPFRFDQRHDSADGRSRKAPTTIREGVRY